MSQTTPPAIKYIAELTDAPDVTLVGTAGPAYWREQLRAEGLFPSVAGGQAEVTIGSVSSRFMGIRFTEMVLTVTVSRNTDGNTNDGLYLVCAFNTSRLFSCIERWVFKTPYRHASVAIQAQPPTFMKLTRGAQTLLQAERRTPAAGERRPEVWEGTIFLPGRKQFHARLGGKTEIVPFDTASDLFTVQPSAEHPALRYLLEGHFTPREWHIRPHANHARSKTVKRTE